MFNYEEQCIKPENAERGNGIDLSEEELRLNQIQQRLGVIETKRENMHERIKQYSYGSIDDFDLWARKVVLMNEVALMQETERLLSEKTKIEKAIETKKQVLTKYNDKQKEIDNITEYSNELQKEINDIDKEIEIRILRKRLIKKVEIDQYTINKLLNEISEKNKNNKKLSQNINNSYISAKKRDKLEKERKKLESEESDLRTLLGNIQDNIITNTLKLEEINNRKNDYRNINIEELNNIKLEILSKINKCNFICDNMLKGNEFEDIASEITNRNGIKYKDLDKKLQYIKRIINEMKKIYQSQNYFDVQESNNMNNENIRKIKEKIEVLKQKLMSKKNDELNNKKTLLNKFINIISLSKRKEKKEQEKIFLKLINYEKELEQYNKLKNNYEKILKEKIDIENIRMLEDTYKKNYDDLKQHNDFIEYIKEIANNGLANTQKNFVKREYVRAKKEAYEREKNKFGKAYADRSFEMDKNNDIQNVEVKIIDYAR